MPVWRNGECEGVAGGGWAGGLVRCCKCTWNEVGVAQRAASGRLGGRDGLCCLGGKWALSGRMESVSSAPNVPPYLPPGLQGEVGMSDAQLLQFALDGGLRGEQAARLGALEAALMRLKRLLLVRALLLCCVLCAAGHAVHCWACCFACAAQVPAAGVCAAVHAVHCWACCAYWADAAALRACRSADDAAGCHCLHPTSPSPCRYVAAGRAWQRRWSSGLGCCLLRMRQSRCCCQSRLSGTCGAWRHKWSPAAELRHLPLPHETHPMYQFISMLCHVPPAYCALDLYKHYTDQTDRLIAPKISAELVNGQPGSGEHELRCRGHTGCRGKRFAIRTDGWVRDGVE